MTGEILAEIENKNARLRFADAGRFESLVRANGRHHLRGNDPLRPIHQQRRRPGRIIKTRRVPAGLFAARVVNLTAVNRVVSDGAVRGLPIDAAGDGEPVAVLEIDFQLAEQFGRGTPRRLVPIPRRFVDHVEPAVAEHDAGGIVAALEQAGDVVSHVERTPVVTGVARFEDR